VDELLRRPRVEQASGLCRSTLYARIATGLYTTPVRLGPRAVAWPSSEVQAINAARIAGRSDTEIHELVVKLHSARRAAVVR